MAWSVTPQRSCTALALTGRLPALHACTTRVTVVANSQASLLTDRRPADCMPAAPPRQPLLTTPDTEQSPTWFSAQRGHCCLHSCGCCAVSAAGEAPRRAALAPAPSSSSSCGRHQSRRLRSLSTFQVKLTLLRSCYVSSSCYVSRRVQSFESPYGYTAHASA